MAKYAIIENANEIEAVQFNGFSKKDGTVMFSEKPDWLVNEFGIKILFFDKVNTLTLKCDVVCCTIHIGDYIIKKYDGSIRGMTKEQFEETYTRLF